MLRILFLCLMVGAGFFSTGHAAVYERSVALPYTYTDPHATLTYSKLQAIINCNNKSKLYSPSSTVPMPDAQGCIDLTTTNCCPAGWTQDSQNRCIQTRGDTKPNTACPYAPHATGTISYGRTITAALGVDTKGKAVSGTSIGNEAVVYSGKNYTMPIVRLDDPAWTVSNTCSCTPAQGNQLSVGNCSRNCGGGTYNVTYDNQCGGTMTQQMACNTNACGPCGAYTITDGYYWVQDAACNIASFNKKTGPSCPSYAPKTMTSWSSRKTYQMYYECGGGTGGCSHMREFTQYTYHYTCMMQ